MYMGNIIFKNSKLETIAQRVIFARLQKGFKTPSALAKKLKVSTTAIQKIESGDSSNSKLLYKISAELTYPPEWIYEGKGYYPYDDDGKILIPKGNVPVFLLKEIAENYDNIKKIPLSSSHEIIALPFGYNANCFGLKIDDESMITPSSSSYESFCPKDKLLIDPDLSLDEQSNETVYVVAYLKKEKIAVIRRFVKEYNACFLKPNDPTYEKMIIDDNVIIIGIVIDKYKSIRKVNS